MIWFTLRLPTAQKCIVEGTLSIRPKAKQEGESNYSEGSKQKLWEGKLCPISHATVSDAMIRQSCRECMKWENAIEPEDLSLFLNPV